MNLDLVLNFALAMIAVVNPLSKVPLYVQASTGQVGPARRRLAVYVTAVAFAVLLVSLWVGRPFLDLFSVDLPAFRVGGGIVILVVGLRMIGGQAVELPDREDEGENPVQQARSRFRRVVVPLAMPIIAGPGSISTAIVYSARTDAPLDYLAMSVVLAAVMTVVLGTLLVSRRVQALVGSTTLAVVTRFLGLIVVGLAMQFVLEGIGEVYPALLTPDSTLMDDGGG